MQHKFFLSAIPPLLLFLGACRSGAECQDRRDAEELRSNAEKIFTQGIGTPAEFLTRQCHPESYLMYHLNRTPKPEHIAAAADIFRSIPAGMTWKIPRMQATVPRLTNSPDVDGNVSLEEWKDALTFSGEYRQDKKLDGPEQKSTWRIAGDDTYLYLAAEFPDSDVLCSSGQEMYQDDCLEFFIRPDAKSPLYHEILLNADGNLWHSLHALRGKERWIRLESNAENWSVAGRRTSSGYSIEAKIPWDAFRFHDCNHVPGRRFEFMLVRINRSGGEAAEATTPVPQLYGGHNVFGYIQAKF